MNSTPETQPDPATTSPVSVPAVPAAVPPQDPHDPHGDESPPDSPAARKRARSLLIIRLVALAMMVVPGIFWLQIWFGGSLDDADVQAYLEAAAATPQDSPDAPKSTRNAMHALDQISDRLAKNDTTVRRFFPLVVKLADHPQSKLRRVTAWVMGDAPTEETFRPALAKLSRDPDPLVRQNAGCALSKFGDVENSRRVLREMLAPYPQIAPVDGKVIQIIAIDGYLKEEMQSAVIETADKKTVSVIAELEGRVREVQKHQGDAVAKGEVLALIQPNPNQVFAALVGLTLVGMPEDIPVLRPFLAAGNGDMIRTQAQQAITAIETRTKNARP